MPAISTSDRVLVRLQSDPPGVIEAPAPVNPVVLVHVGPSVEIACDRGGRKYRGVTVHGDIDVIPPGVPSRWELAARDQALVVSLPGWLLQQAAQHSGAGPVQLLDRFQVRDTRIEHIAWALQAEMESGYRGGRLYLEGLGMAMAACLIDRHSSLSPRFELRKSPLAGRRLRRVLSHIEDNLHQGLSLQDIAAVAELSVSHCKAVFREAVGLPLHQYVIERRAQRAKSLLEEGDLPIAEVALRTGFAHQSHLAHHLRRLFGATPKSLREGCAPNQPLGLRRRTTVTDLG